MKSAMRVGIAIGGNVGDKLAHFQRACLLLESEGIEIVKKAPIFSSEPVDCPPGSPSFYNSGIEVMTDLQPLKLLEITQSIEAVLGRDAVRKRNAPRPVDLDIIYAGDLVLNDSRLVIPHPRMHLRRFVLEPFSHICPERVMPEQNISIMQILQTNTELPLELAHKLW